jgi:ABC-type molybdate transport system substrate-binding protein
MNHPGHIGMEKNSGPAGRMRTARYEITYYSAAKKSGGDFAELPAVMNLSDDSLSSIYAKASFAVDENNTVTATPIAHAITIPKTALHKQAAQEFARMFLAIDKQAEGFISREGVFGLDPLQSDFTGKPH